MVRMAASKLLDPVCPTLLGLQSYIIVTDMLGAIYCV